MGSRFVFVPDAIGLHEIEASVTDKGDKTAIALCRVNVTGPLPMFDPVRLVPDAMSAKAWSCRPTGWARTSLRLPRSPFAPTRAFITAFSTSSSSRDRSAQHRRWDRHRGRQPRSLRAARCSAFLLGQRGGWNLAELMFSTDFTANFNYKNTESYYGFAVDYRGVPDCLHHRRRDHCRCGQSR